ncbi:hypothetical protein IWQ62_001698 [Dispira parvispora]|uniref:Chitin-binding type-4 domain-containing protein n=1 Tax=Dispira parvispora TaxID=1520584 RepID=A0A9W8E4M5_9FUNG|nr:hypothetical protein IWQ62_001698 [Dispira parvispora]
MPITLSALVAGCLGHMYPSTPCMRGSPLPNCKYPKPNFDLTSPIGSGGRPAFPICHHTEPYPSPVATYQAGSSITVTFETSATHNGGNCEFSLSYDGGKTFVAIQTIMKTCFLNGKTFNVPIPKDAPSGKAVFAWSWVNATGNREFYMTCSDIEIQGTPGGKLVGPRMITPNYDANSPHIGEFGSGNGDDGAKYYTDRPTITLTANGGASVPEGNAGDQKPPKGVETLSHTAASTSESVYSGRTSTALSPTGDVTETCNSVPTVVENSVSGTTTTGSNPATVVGEDPTESSSTAVEPVTDGQFQCEASGKSPVIILFLLKDR